MGVCYGEWKRRRDSAYLTVRWTILDTDAKMLLKGCWMWVCVSPSSSLPVLSMCVCVYNDARQRGGESTAQHKWWLHSLFSLSFCQISSCVPAIYIFFACWTLFFIFVLFFTLLTKYSFTFNLLSLLVLSSFCLCFCLSLLPHPFPSVSVEQHSDVTQWTHTRTHMLLDCDALNVICFNGFSASLSNGSEQLTTYWQHNHRQRITHSNSSFLTTQRNSDCLHAQENSEINWNLVVFQLM